jgi:hypothetical protein
MGLRIENVQFFPEKNDFIISRGLKIRYGSFTREGKPVVQLKGFEKYYFDPDTCGVFSRQGSKTFTLLTPQKEGVKDYYQLYLHGQKRKVYLWQILRDNLEGIQLFFSGKKKVRDTIGTPRVHC